MARIKEMREYRVEMVNGEWSFGLRTHSLRTTYTLHRKIGFFSYYPSKNQ